MYSMTAALQVQRKQMSEYIPLRQSTPSELIRMTATLQVQRKQMSQYIPYDRAHHHNSSGWHCC